MLCYAFALVQGVRCCGPRNLPFCPHAPPRLFLAPLFRPPAPLLHFLPRRTHRGLQNLLRRGSVKKAELMLFGGALALPRSPSLSLRATPYPPLYFASSFRSISPTGLYRIHASFTPHTQTYTQSPTHVHHAHTLVRARAHTHTHTTHT
jgi:hypothetical protein